MRPRTLLIGFLGLAGCNGLAAHADEKQAAQPTRADKVVKTDAEWKKILSPLAYDVMRHQGTEVAFSGPYWNDHRKAIYRCAACGLVLFRSDDKFDSGTGWPSFTRPATADAVAVQKDNSLGIERDEVHCPRCGGHLGHVFDDGPKPTGLRYCINGVALKQELVK
ncbi:MAG TPA: peptide-methionine (R)-S-oxide reductase MsrB [Polyangia bacterium]|nr:peptide-methionine (R)-S-oxide reductase MsrB [Polyangia bacterium]